MPVAVSAGPEKIEKATAPVDLTAPSGNAQVPSVAVAPSTLIPDNAATVASLRMVCPLAFQCIRPVFKHLYGCVKREIWLSMFSQTSQLSHNFHRLLVEHIR